MRRLFGINISFRESVEMQGHNTQAAQENASFSRRNLLGGVALTAAGAAVAELATSHSLCRGAPVAAYTPIGIEAPINPESELEACISQLRTILSKMPMSHDDENLSFSAKDGDGTAVSVKIYRSRKRDEQSDPLLSAIASFLAGEVAFGAIKEKDWDAHGGEASVIRETFGRPMEILEDWDRPAITLDGAIAALRLADRENRTHGECDVSVAMVRAAAAFFERQGHSTETGASARVGMAGKVYG
ncbi:hypothetical protein LJR030_000530 [Rhizobium sp. LjRoot30]|uniref:hypothetical protein n=1 Tax=Rhizobium sp. LjRoot30 TaxID=3342320 RepID=UPI003ECE4BE5